MTTQKIRRFSHQQQRRSRGANRAHNYVKHRVEGRKKSAEKSGGTSSCRRVRGAGVRRIHDPGFTVTGGDDAVIVFIKFETGFARCCIQCAARRTDEKWARRTRSTSTDDPCTSGSGHSKARASLHVSSKPRGRACQTCASITSGSGQVIKGFSNNVFHGTENAPSAPDGALSDPSMTRE